MRRFLLLTMLCIPSLAFCQAPAAPPQDKVAPYKAPEHVDTVGEMDRKSIVKAELEGIEARVKDVAHFRGTRSNQLSGIGIVTGLEGTGDTKKSPQTLAMLSNYFRANGVPIDLTQLETKNMAVVSVTCELPAFAKPGSVIDVRVSSFGDAKSLQGGELMQTPLYANGNHDKAIVVAAGALSIGGFNVSSNGSSAQRNHVNVGRIPGGGIVESPVPTRFVFDGGRMFLDLDQEDMTTAHRAAIRIAQQYPQFLPNAVDGSTIVLQVPPNMDPVAVVSMVQAVRVNSDIEAKIVINERTGTIVVGGNVAIAPCAVAQGSLQVRVQQNEQTVQPGPLSNGTTAKDTNSQIDAGQENAKVALIAPKTTVADLAKLLQALKLKPTDIISILQALRQQGALKARIELQ